MICNFTKAISVKVGDTIVTGDSIIKVINIMNSPTGNVSFVHSAGAINYRRLDTILVAFKEKNKNL